MTAWDEMVTGRGGVRPQWRGILGTVLSLEPPGLADRAARLGRTAEEEGSVPSWRCDPIPLPLTGREFTALEQGLEQRARLLEAILTDVYGEQTTLASGALPPALVYANPGFLRACRDGSAPRGPFLHAYAADLVRSADGQWRVLADRTGGALGVGTARETRRLLARVMPELFRGNPVRGLRPFFDAWQDALIRAAPAGLDRVPMVAMLTGGNADPHWPEHSALSRDLGCALVEARDLSVRDGKLYLKTLQGLRQIDVLLRRIKGHRLDPLESPEAAPGGVMGLLEAARQGAVRIVNHPGAAVVEAPALAAFMPSLCRKLLGEPLRLATWPSLWMADKGAKRMVAAGFRRWAVRSAFDGAAPAVPLAELPWEERAALEDAIAAEPWSYLGCTVVQPSLAPCQGQGGLVAEPIVLRLFLIHDGRRWRMMPGGVARVLPPGAHAGEAFPADGVFKDVWVLSEENAEIRGPEAAPQPRVAPRRGGGDLPSRVADDFYWLGRYVERLEAQARLGRAGLLRRARGAPLPRELAEVDVLGACLAEVGVFEGGVGGAIEDAVWAALQSTGAMSVGLDHAARLTAALRDRLTVQTHGAFQHAIKVARTQLHEGLHSGLDGLVHAMTGLQLLATTVAGVTADGMVQGGGRLFLELGRRLERAVVTAGTLATVLAQPAGRTENALRMALELCDSVLTYRNRYAMALQPGPVLDLVLLDDGNPRALAYQFVQVAGLLQSAGDAGLAWAANDLQERIAAMVEQVLLAHDPALATAKLPQPLRDVAAATAALSDSVTRRFFALLPPSRAIGLEVA